MGLIDEYYAFDYQQLIASGSESELAEKINSYIKQKPESNILYFDRSTGRQTELDLQAHVAGLEVDLKLPVAGTETPQVSSGKKARGRPKLGVVGREVTLLPRHWQWLDKQRSGASAALRRLIDEERKNSAAQDEIRESQDSANRFMSAIAGDLRGFEEAVRALYAGDKARFEAETAAWPVDIRQCARQFAESALI